MLPADPPAFFKVANTCEEYARKYHDLLVTKITSKKLEVTLSKQGEGLVCWVTHCFSEHLGDFMRYFNLVTGYGYGVTKNQVSLNPSSQPASQLACLPACLLACPLHVVSCDVSLYTVHPFGCLGDSFTLGKYRRELTKLILYGQLPYNH